MIFKLTTALGLATLVGCASAPRKNEPKTVVYTEKAAPLELTAVAATCPADVGAGTSAGATSTTTWRDLVPTTNACVRDGQWSKVETLGTRIATAAPTVPWGSYYLSLSAAARKDYARARWMLELCLKKAPDQAIFHYQLARLYWDLGDDAGVFREMKTAAALSPELSDAHVFAGQIALRRADLPEARRELRTALATEPRNQVALLALSQVELNAGDFAAAEDVLVRAVDASPRNAQARLALARVQEVHLKKTNEALVTLRELRQLATDRKLDGATPVDLGERIQNLEKSLAQAQRDGKVSKRQPTAEGKEAL